MIRLNSIKIKGFKDPTYEKQLVFSDEPISVIYGENGSGKTTLLKILFAVLSKNEKTLLQENVCHIEIQYTKANEQKTLLISRDDDQINWGDNLDLFNTSSILFGVHRGVLQDKGANQHMDKERLKLLIDDLRDISRRSKYKDKTGLFGDELFFLFDKIEEIKSHENIEEILYLIKKIRDSISNRKHSEEHERIDMIRRELEYYAFDRTYQNEKSRFLNKLDTQAHLSTDFVKIEDIQNAIINQFKEGQSIISEKIKTAFFETIEKAVEIDETNEDFQLPDDFEKRIEENKDFILKAITKENSTLTERIKKYLKTGDNSLTEKSKIFRAMLLNIIESAEEPNPTLEAITKLIEIFNEHLYGNKELIVDIEKAYIKLENDNFHQLSELSSGERNLLSILTLFLIIGNERNFLMIDEPEISFNIKWQRDFLPLLSRLNSNAQIIVASHSPSISHNNSKYLVQLK